MDWFHHLKAQGQSNPQDSFGFSPARSKRLHLSERVCAGCCEPTAAHWASLKQQPLLDVPRVQMLTYLKVLGTEWDKSPRDTSSLCLTVTGSRCDGILYLQGHFGILSQPFMMRRNQWVRVHFQQQNGTIFIPFWCFQAFFPYTEPPLCVPPTKQNKGTNTARGLNNSLSTVGETWNAAVLLTLTQQA